MSYAPAAYWDAYFDSLQQSGRDLDWGEEWTSAFIPTLRQSQAHRVLDLGCGTGNDLLRLARAGFEAIGLDYSRQAILAAHRKQIPLASFVLGDMAQGLPFLAAQFDAVMTNVSMHMFNDAITRRLIADIKRILQPHGLLLFHVNALEDRPLRAKGKPVVRELEPNYVVEADGQTMHFFSEAYLRDLLHDWSEVTLELLTIPGQIGADWSKCAWRGRARA